MPEASDTPWMLELAMFVGVFSAMTWGFLVLFKPRTYRPETPQEPPDATEE